MANQDKTSENISYDEIEKPKGPFKTFEHPVFHNVYRTKTDLGTELDVRYKYVVLSYPII